MSGSGKPQPVRRMFSAIAPRYDLLNHLLSANLDRSWRRAAAAALPAGPLERVLDLCGGTGDLALAVARARRVDRIVCCDFSHPMLALAARKFRRSRRGAACRLLEADALGLPFADGTFDAVTVGFGVRNFSDLDLGLREIARVLRPGGALVVLEFSRPARSWLGRLYSAYLGRLLPRIGDAVSRHSGPYGYLARTIAAFPDPAALADRIRNSGFDSCRFTTLSAGIVAVHTADKPPLAPLTPRRAEAGAAPSARAGGFRPAGR